MATQTFTPEMAKRWMKYASSFKNDDRCKDVVYVTGADYAEVLTRTKELHAAYAEGVDKVTDYDVNFDNVGDCYVGVVCVDK